MSMKEIPFGKNYLTNKARLKGVPVVGDGVTICSSDCGDKYAGTIVKTRNGGMILYIQRDYYLGDNKFERNQNAETEMFTSRKTDGDSVYIRHKGNQKTGDYLIFGVREEFVDYSGID